MLLRVLRTDNYYDYIKNSMLQRLIESKGIIKFKRSTGWVTIGADPIRESKRDNVISDTERRAVKD
ncbi:MAG: hypothetical protein H7Y05_13520 [Steroidobacteraceae bacterium]|nr:hypothetical protein [Deltaproteobacteria bacterium]